MASNTGRSSRVAFRDCRHSRTARRPRSSSAARVHLLFALASHVSRETYTTLATSRASCPQRETELTIGDPSLRKPHREGAQSPEVEGRRDTTLDAG